MARFLSKISIIIVSIALLFCFFPEQTSANTIKKEASISLKGVALKNPTHVYSNTSKKYSIILKSYKQGQILKFKKYNNNWYIATVYIDKKAHTGYISRDDVDAINAKTAAMQGIANNKPTRVYSTPSRQSNVLKTYKYGSTLKLRTFTSKWYEATVIINGKRKTGYIQRSDIKNVNTTLSGYTLANKTYVYSKTSKKSTKLKGYKKGQQIKYRPYNSNWFRATVYVNGKKRTGYISTNDVRPNLTLTGYAQKNPIYVYSKTSKNAIKLKRYKKGQKLKFKPYNSNWYIATVYVNGKKRTGYIHVKDVVDTPQQTAPTIKLNNTEIKYLISDKLSSDEQKMFELINNERKKRGAKPLKINMELTKIARLKAYDMIKNDYFDHDSPTYGSPFEMVRQFGISYYILGENLAGAIDVKTAHNALMDSPDHKANILYSEFTEIGIGIVDGGRWGKIYVQLFRTPW